jgi:glycosyltransferase involved in cell wall biosynthesis
MPYNIGQGKVKAYCYLSEWHKENLLNVFKQSGLTEHMMYPVTNGYSKKFYENIELDKKENCMIWSSTIIRGFDLFYKWVFLPVLMRYPDFKLYICGYTSIPEEQQIHENCKLLPGVEVLGKLSKEELAEYQKKSKIWVYPGTFPETFCITAVENAAAGNVIISPLSYGLGSTLQYIPYLKETNLPILSKDTAHLYINSICNVLGNQEMYKECQRQCLHLSNIYSWKRTAEEFINLFNQTEQ